MEKYPIKFNKQSSWVFQEQSLSLGLELRFPVSSESSVHYSEACMKLDQNDVFTEQHKQMETRLKKVRQLNWLRGVNWHRDYLECSNFKKTIVPVLQMYS